jgi:hypothetical protein
MVEPRKDLNNNIGTYHIINLSRPKRTVVEHVKVKVIYGPMGDMGLIPLIYELKRTMRGIIVEPEFDLLQEEAMVEVDGVRMIYDPSWNMEDIIRALISKRALNGEHVLIPFLRRDPSLQGGVLS